MPEGSHWETKLRAAGCRVTRARLLVLEALAELSHATGEELLAHVAQAAPELNLSTIYRTLDALGEVGLVTHAHLHHGVVTYHAVDEPAHIHLVCRRCGQVSSIPAGAAAQLAATVADLTGFRTDLSHLALHGQCATCAGSPSGSTQAPAVLGSA
jgi:Fur family ferric uptake transcriptional regulator